MRDALRRHWVGAALGVSVAIQGVSAQSSGAARVSLTVAQATQDDKARAYRVYANAIRVLRESGRSEQEILTAIKQSADNCGESPVLIGRHDDGLVRF